MLYYIDKNHTYLTWIKDDLRWVKFIKNVEIYGLVNS